MHKDRVVIVTGSTSGIGEFTAKAFGNQGAKILITGRDSERGEQVVEAIRANGGDAAYQYADLLDPLSPKQLVDRAIELWGTVDVIVNNAALVCNKPLEQINHADWDRLFEVNVKAPFFLIQAALPYLKLNKGCVVNISSINGIRNDRDNLVYDTMKAALNHMTSGLALDLLKEGVRFNAVLPAGIATPLVKTWLEQKLGNSTLVEQELNKVSKDLSLGQPQQVADVVVFLASAQASWLNGAVIPLEGGYSLGQG